MGIVLKQPKGRLAEEKNKIKNPEQPLNPCVKGAVFLLVVVEVVLCPTMGCLPPDPVRAGGGRPGEPRRPGPARGGAHPPHGRGGAAAAVLAAGGGGPRPGRQSAPDLPFLFTEELGPLHWFWSH